ncbi:MAG: cytidine deaminase [Calditrichaeota bacterium]|nr:MAG: cytidine deaminase [Calditrichota bacterium]
MNSENIHTLLLETRNKALALYSNFHVGAILETEDKQLITGFNIETSSYGLTICAERVALFKALSEGIRNFKNIYIMGDGKSFCPPCGACRQVLMDFAPNIQVILMTEEGKQQTFQLSELLPHAFDDKFLKK